MSPLNTHPHINSSHYLCGAFSLISIYFYRLPCIKPNHYRLLNPNLNSVHTLNMTPDTITAIPIMRARHHGQRAVGPHNVLVLQKMRPTVY